MKVYKFTCAQKWPQQFICDKLIDPEEDSIEVYEKEEVDGLIKQMEYQKRTAVTAERVRSERLLYELEKITNEQKERS